MPFFCMNPRQAISEEISSIIQLNFNVERISYNQGLVHQIWGKYQPISLIFSQFLNKIDAEKKGDLMMPGERYLHE